MIAKSSLLFLIVQNCDRFTQSHTRSANNVQGNRGKICASGDWGDGEQGRWGDGEQGSWGAGEMSF
ncbi:hypothetical protein VF09_08950, partial [Nostoc linckia z9]